MKCATRRCSRGFTLLELMLVVAIVGILATMSVHMWGNFFPMQELKSAGRAMQNAIGQARAQAVLTSSNVSVTVTGGRIYAFVDTNNNGTFDAGDTRVFQYPDDSAAALPANIVFKSQFSSQGSPSTVATLIVNYEGLLMVSGALVSGVVCITDTNLNQTQAVQMTVAGACRIQQQAAAKILCP